jgi:hypothetical protein
VRDGCCYSTARRTSVAASTTNIFTRQPNLSIRCPPLQFAKDSLKGMADGAIGETECERRQTEVIQDREDKKSLVYVM